MRARLNVSAVSYLNTVPFVYGLRQPMVREKINLSLDYPAECARKLKNGAADIGLVPVAALNDLEEVHLIGNYCIGSNGRVRTVTLFSNQPLEEIERIHLDFESRTSVLLVKVLAREYWNKTFEWVSTYSGADFTSLPSNQGLLAIGDKVFGLEQRFKFAYDLSDEWKKMTGLPFVFAAWAANKPIDGPFIETFNGALKFGVLHIAEALKVNGSNGICFSESLDYLSNNISYPFTSEKAEAMNLFLKLAQNILAGTGEKTGNSSSHLH